tara:strand:+ start:1097 stop:1855 length:759 start_codon:yes stop_codon:yes gene_type:complete
MAFLGSLGRVFGITTPEAGRIGAAFATGGLGQAALTTLQSLGDQPATRTAVPVDVSAPPAGVDSLATLSKASQTSRTFGTASEFDGRMLGGPGTGTQSAFIGGLGVPGLIGQAGRLLSRPGVGGALTGIGAGLGLDVITDMFGNTKKLVITRKLQRDVKKVFMMSGGDIGFVSSNSMMLFGKSLNEDQILMILFKTFKNQGPFVTKAAVRKTRQTIRKMETLCDLKDRLCPPRTTRRRTPARKSSTMITQVK